MKLQQELQFIQEKIKPELNSNVFNFKLEKKNQISILKNHLKSNGRDLHHMDIEFVRNTKSNKIK